MRIGFVIRLQNDVNFGGETLYIWLAKYNYKKQTFLSPLKQSGYL